MANREATLDILSHCTGQSPEKLQKDTDRMFYLTPEEAKDYGLIDRVLASTKELPKQIPAGIS